MTYEKLCPHCEKRLPICIPEEIKKDPVALFEYLNSLSEVKELMRSLADK